MNEDEFSLGKIEYLENLQLGCNKLIFNENERRFVMEKGKELIDLYLELEKDNKLKQLAEIEFKKVHNVLKHFDEIEGFLRTLLNLFEGYKGGNRTRKNFPIKDNSGNEYHIRINQIVLIIGWAYCSLCEVMKTMLSEIINFPKKPHGIGDVIRQLGEYNPAYFSDVETDIRNSFFHLDFEFHGDKILYNGNNKSITVQELFDRLRKLDLLDFTLIGLIMTLEHKIPYSNK